MDVKQVQNKVLSGASSLELLYKVMNVMNMNDVFLTACLLLYRPRFIS